jgi:hypothetical protein
MLASVRFSDRVVEPPAGAPTPVATPVDGVWAASWTLEDLLRSPLLYGSGELNDGNWGQNTLTLQSGQYSLTVTNAKLTATDHGTYHVDGDTLTFVHGTETFVMDWSVAGDQLTFSRDPSLGIAPTPLIIKPWARER